jgi:hypothetical protein
VIAIPWKTIGALALVLIGAASAWQGQEWRYGAQLAEQSRLHTDTLNQLAVVGATAQKAEQDKRLALEQRVASSDKAHYEILTNDQKNQDRLRDGLATADVRLSVLLAAGSAGSGSVPASPGSGGVVYGSARAELDPAHAQRIVAITNEGDRGIIALAACQAYVRELSR